MPSDKLQARQSLGRERPLSTDEFDAACLLADIIEATPQGQRTQRMQDHLARVRGVVSAEVSG
jgi:hypothetical protein